MLLQYFKPGVLRNLTLPSSRTWNTTQYSSVEKGTFFKRVHVGEEIIASVEFLSNVSF